MGQKATVTYNLKETTGKLNVQADKYTPELRQFVQEELAEQLYYFGYAKPQGMENPTGFYEFEEDTKENMENYYKYQTDSQAAL